MRRVLLLAAGIVQQILALKGLSDEELSKSSMKWDEDQDEDNEGYDQEEIPLFLLVPLVLILSLCAYHCTTGKRKANQSQRIPSIDEESAARAARLSRFGDDPDDTDTVTNLRLRRNQVSIAARNNEIAGRVPMPRGSSAASAATCTSDYMQSGVEQMYGFDSVNHDVGSDSGSEEEPPPM